MSRKVTLIDDVDGISEGAETRRIVLGEDSYTIDLTQENWDKLLRAIKRYTDKATPIGPRPAANSDQQKIREWAITQGLTVSAKGRIAQDVQDAYNNRDQPVQPILTAAE